MRSINVCILLLALSAFLPAAPITVEPLAKSALTLGAESRFVRIDSEASGLGFTNPYDDPEMWTSRFLEHGFGSIASGIAAGDVDGNGLPDLYFVRRAGPNHLYLNRGGLRFELLPKNASIAGPAAWNNGATFVDIDDDADLDLYVCYHGAPNLLYINAGDGTFTESGAEWGLDVTSNTVMAAFADYDRDGDLDVFLATNRLDAAVREGEPDYLLRNNGAGRFEDVTAAAGLTGDYQTFAGIWWDYDNDGWLDLYVANDFSGPDFFYRNRGDGGFEDVKEEALQITSHYSMGADFGDINNDGFFDLLTTDMYPRDHRRYLKNQAELSETLWVQDTKTPPQRMRNALQLNAGTGRFMEIAWMAGIAASDWTWCPLFGDLDNDGLQDLFITNGMFRDFMDSDSVMRISRSRGKSNAVWKRGDELREANIALKNTGEFVFEPMAAAWGLDDVGISFGAVLSDLDRDGDLDVVYNNYEASPGLLRNDAAPGHAALVQLRGRAGNCFGIGARVVVETPNGVRRHRLLIPARGVASGQEPVAHFGLGAADRITKLTVFWPGGGAQHFEDVAADALITIEEPASTSTDLPIKSPVRNPNPLFVEVGGRIGLAAGARSSPAALPFVPAADQPLLPFRQDRYGGELRVHDVNGDGDQDLMHIARPGLPPIGFLRQGLGRFEVIGGGSQPAASTKANAEPAMVSLQIDFDQDGDMDSVVGGHVLPGQYPRSTPTRLLENRDGRFADVTALRAAPLAHVGLVRALVAADFVGDDRMDLAVASEWGAVSVFENTDAGFVDQSKATGLSGITGLWQSLGAGDIDGDGDMDLIAGNIGLNTRYTASAEKPALLFLGEFGRPGEHHIVEARYDAGVLRPWRGRTQLMSALESPDFARRMLKGFRRYREYADASLEQILTPEALAAAEVFRATELRSGVFRNGGSRGFAFEPLPGIAQNAPVFGILVVELDGDGFLDLAVVQNTRAPGPEIDPFVGGLGLVMLGLPKGRWLPLSPYESGFEVPGEGRAIAVMDWNEDGWPDLVASRFGEPLLAFEHRGAEAASAQARSSGTGRKD